jgi:hypothetical protein
MSANLSATAENPLRSATLRRTIDHQFESAKIGLPLASLISDTHNF